MNGDAFIPSPVSATARFFYARLLLALLPFAASCDAYNQLFGDAQCDTLAIAGIPSLMHVGDTAHLRVFLRDKHNRSVQCVGAGSANWSSSDPTVLSVIGSHGELVARAAGVVTITAQTGELAARARIEVATP